MSTMFGRRPDPELSSSQNDRQNDRTNGGLRGVKIEIQPISPKIKQ